MARKDLFSLEGLKHIIYIPSIIHKIKNWHSFLMNYVGFKNSAEIYKFRNGAKLETTSSVDASTIAVVWIKKDYGNIPNNSVIIDIGANIGTFSIYAATNSKKSQIYAYEPLKKTYDLLTKNIQINKLKNIKAFKLGIGSKKEKRKLFLANSSPFNSIYEIGKGKSETINCISLKDVFEQNNIKHCDILKIDCEGAEFEIFYNTPAKYLQRIKEIRMEYHNQKIKTYHIKNLIEFLRKNGFKVSLFRKDSNYSGNAWLKLR